MNTTKILLTLLSVIILHPTQAQDMGKVLFNTSPNNALIKINTVIYHPQEEIDLPVGNYLVEIWAPKMAIFKDSITIEKDETLTYHKGLSGTSVAYQEYRKKSKKYLRHETVKYSADVLVIGTNIWGTYYIIRKSPSFLRSKDRVLQAKLVYEEHAISVEEFQIARLLFETERDNYETAKRNHNRKIVIGIPLLAVSYGVSAYYFSKRRKKKNVKPLYKEKEPFFVSLMELQPNITYQNDGFKFSISLKF